MTGSAGAEKSADPAAVPGRGGGVRAHAALVALVAVAAFAVCVRGEFVWDDGAFSAPSAKLARVTDPLAFFTKGIWQFATVRNDDADETMYRPVSVLAGWLLLPALGRVPARWHLYSLCLHGAASVLVYLLARRLSRPGNALAPLAAGVIFAVHPVHTEAVAYVSASFHVLVTIFALVAAHAQLTHARTGRLRWLVASGAATTAALMTSEGALVLPFLLVALEWTERRVRPRAHVLAACAAPLALVLVLRAHALRTPVPLRVGRDSVLTALSFSAAYVRDLLFPWPQPVYLSIPRRWIIGPGGVASAAVAIVSAAALVVRTPKDERWAPGFAIGWSLGFLAPLAAAGASAAPFFAPRALYLPSVGVALLVSWGVERVAPGPSPRTRRALGAIALAGILAGNVASLGWRDELRVHLRMLEADPELGKAHALVGDILSRRGERARAEPHFAAAFRFAEPGERPGVQEAYALHCLRVGRPEDGLRLMRLVVAEEPGRADAWVNMGVAAFSSGDLAAARDAYESALRLEPDNLEAAYNLGVVLEAAHQGGPVRVDVRQIPAAEDAGDAPGPAHASRNRP